MCCMLSINSWLNVARKVWWKLRLFLPVSAILFKTLFMQSCSPVKDTSSTTPTHDSFPEEVYDTLSVEKDPLDAAYWEYNVRYDPTPDNLDYLIEDEKDLLRVDISLKPDWWEWIVHKKWSKSLYTNKFYGFKVFGPNDEQIWADIKFPYSSAEYTDSFAVEIPVIPCWEWRHKLLLFTTIFWYNEGEIASHDYKIIIADDNIQEWRLKFAENVAWPLHAHIVDITDGDIFDCDINWLFRAWDVLTLTNPPCNYLHGWNAWNCYYLKVTGPNWNILFEMTFFKN